jgi:hypothetical protein
MESADIIPFLLKCLYQVRVITVFTVFRLLTDFVCLYNYEFWLSLWKIVRNSVILLLPLFIIYYSLRRAYSLSFQKFKQRPICDIAWLHATNHLYHGFRGIRYYLVLYNTYNTHSWMYSINPSEIKPLTFLQILHKFKFLKRQRVSLP